MWFIFPVDQVNRPLQLFAIMDYRVACGQINCNAIIDSVKVKVRDSRDMLVPRYLEFSVL